MTLYENLIAAFKKANKERRQKIAEKNGFKTPQDYLKFLQSQTVILGDAYVVDVSDASGSMSGGKYENSKKGIRLGILDLQKRNDVKYSLLEFVDSQRTNNIFEDVDPKKIATNNISFWGASGGNTPLYKTVYDVLNRLKEVVKSNDTVLVKIYTDGINNILSQYVQLARNLIAECKQKGWMISFVATTYDMKRIVGDMQLDESNTLTVENSEQGFEKAYAMSRSATQSYFSSRDAGEVLNTGFYKKSGKL